MAGFDLKGLDELIKRATDSALTEVLSPILEDEKKKQKDMSDRLKELEGSDESEELEEGEEEGDEEEASDEEAVDTKIATGKDEPEEPKVVVPTADDVANVDVKQIINMLNMLRSGKSTKDPEIKDQLKGYFDGLDPGERQALFILLSGLSQILAGGVDGSEAPDPSTVGIKISARRATQDMSDKEEKAAKKQASAPQGSEKPKVGSEELPIVVGEVADKRAVKQKLRLLR